LLPKALFGEVVMKHFLWLLVTLPRRIAYFLRTGYMHTGERVNPDFPEANFQNHFKVYKFLDQFARDKDVLDVGCGTGYGTAYLRTVAKSIVGIDVSKSAIRFARKRYPETRTLVMDAHSLQLQPQSVDLLVSTENFEHLKDQEKSLLEVIRVLRPGGVCFIATPNRELSTGTNPYHTHEFTVSELKALLSRYFEEVEVWPSMLQNPDLTSLVVLDPKELTVFGLSVDTTYLSNTHSMFSFSRCPKLVAPNPLPVSTRTKNLDASTDGGGILTATGS
jgi:ubiquinone/menaquinone biosynthesis C-methylase UbiE